MEKFMVSTTHYHWGIGGTLKEAAKNAEALNRKGLVKKGIKIRAWFAKVESPLTAEQLEELSVPYGMDGYEPGDLVKPFFDFAGSPIVIGGTLKRIGDFAEGEEVVEKEAICE